MSNSEKADVSKDTESELSDIISILSNISEETQESKATVLLNSLKPYLSKKRQKKLEQCEKIISLTDTLKVLNDLHMFDDFLGNTDE